MTRWDFKHANFVWHKNDSLNLHFIKFKAIVMS